jgi:RecA/RadA recombinase
MDLKSLYIVQPDYGEQAFSIADELARSGAMDMIVVDSVSALVPRSEIEGDYGVPQVRGTVQRQQQLLLLQQLLQQCWRLPTPAAAAAATR